MRKYVTNHMALFIKVISSNLLYTISIAMIPLITKYFFDRIDKINFNTFIIIAFAYLLSIFFGMLFQYFNQASSWELEKNININIKSKLLKSILSRNHETYITETIGSYISRLDNEVETVVKNYVNGYIEVIQGIIQYCVFALFIFLVDPRIAIIMILCSWVVIIVPRLTSKEFSRRKSEHLALVGQYFEKIRSLLEGHSLVNKMTLPQLHKRGEEYTEEMEKGLLHFGIYKSLVNVLTGFMTYSLNLLSFIIIGILLLLKKITLGTGVATLGYMGNLVFPIRYILDNYNLIMSANDTKDRLLILLNEKGDERIFLKSVSKIELKNASIHYSNYFLSDINIEFLSDRRYLLEGKNGTGKTTLLNVLSGNQRLTSGNLYFDQHEVDEICIEDVVSYLNQADYIFPADFLDNVTVFNSYSKENLDKLLAYFPQSMVTKLIITQNCLLLSGGEKQVLSLIRCVLRGKSIFLLDEPFSAMDKVTKEHAKRLVLNEMIGLVIISNHESDFEFLKGFDNVVRFGENTVKIDY
jgi:ATP-binding cassette, subfamily B, bacterial